MLALGLTCILSKVSEWQSLYFNNTVTTDSLVTSGWSICFPVHTPSSLVLPRKTTTWRRFSPSRSCLVLTLIVLYFPFYVHFKLYLFYFLSNISRIHNSENRTLTWRSLVYQLSKNWTFCHIHSGSFYRFVTVDTHCTTSPVSKTLSPPSLPRDSHSFGM